MKHIPVKFLTLAVGAMSAAMNPRAEAALVTWSDVQAITSNLDIVNPDSVVLARNYGPASANINVAVGASTVTFVPASLPFNQPAGDLSFFNPTGTTVASDFESVLDSFSYS